MGTLVNNKTQLKCRMMLHFIRVCNVCYSNIKAIVRDKKHHYLENSTQDPLKNTMGSAVLIVWKIPSEYKGLTNSADCNEMHLIWVYNVCQS